MRPLVIVVTVILVLIAFAWFIRPFVNRKREELIYTMVNDITKILSDSKINVYADFGTLLGAYRDGGVIHDDMDGDLAILRKDEESSYTALSKNLDPNKYSLVRDPAKLKVWIKGTSVGCDIAIYDEKETNLTRQTFTIPYGKVFPLKTISWGKNKVNINIPRDPEWYLEYEYGSTWNVPRSGDKGREGVDKGQIKYSKVYSYVYKLGAALAGVPLLFK